MKKIVLSFLLVFTVVLGYSQSLTLADSSGVLANNASVNRIGHVTDPEITSYCFVHNTTSSAITVLVKKVEISLITGSVNTFCWGGSCYPPTTYISPNPDIIGGNRTDSVDFSGHYNPNPSLAGISTVRYVFFNQANPNDSVCVNIHYDALYVGLNNQIARNVLSTAYPNPANNTVNFTYDITAGTTATVTIRNLVGSVVKTEDLTATEGKLSISTADIPDGVYFYSLDIEGKSITTHKLIVKH